MNTYGHVCTGYQLPEFTPVHSRIGKNLVLSTLGYHSISNTYPVANRLSSKLGLGFQEPAFSRRGEGTGQEQLTGSFRIRLS